MIDTLPEPIAASVTRKRCDLLLHCGSHAVTRSQIATVPTPRRTQTWQPVPHLTVLNTVEAALLAHRLKIVNSAYALNKEDNRFFALLEIQTDRSAADYSWVVGVRNSHDKTFPAGIVAGTQVLVCDNLAFCGEIKLARKHTRFILRDLDTLAHHAVNRLVDRFDEQERRIDRYKHTPLRDANAHDLIIRSVDKGVCSNQHIPKILGLWREPPHECFQKRTLWSLLNAFTEGLKGNLNLLPARTERLHKLLDATAGPN